MEFIKSIKANYQGFIISSIIVFVGALIIYAKNNKSFDINFFLMSYTPIVFVGVFSLMCFFIILLSDKE